SELLYFSTRFIIRSIGANDICPLPRDGAHSCDANRRSRDGRKGRSKFPHHQPAVGALAGVSALPISITAE
ncbi:MAG TPA: hypothetical protein VFZ10_10685, partial [Geminicoccaceae bacterium]